MKKRIIMIVISTILVVAFFKYKDIYKLYKINQISKDVVNCINGKFSKNINNITIKQYKRFHKTNRELNHYNITQLVNKYIEMSEKGVEEYKKGVLNKFKVEHININEPMDVERGEEIWMRYDELKYDIADNITDEDVKNYDNGKFQNILIEKLKTILDYEEKDGKIEWQVNSTEDIRIELPYDCYIDYEAYCYELNKNFNKALSVVDNNNFNIDKLSNSIIVKFERKDGSLYNNTVILNKWDDGTYTISLSDLGVSKNSLASATLKNHTGDKKWEAQSGVWSYEW